VDRNDNVSIVEKTTWCTCKQLLHAQIFYIVFNNEQYFLAAANGVLLSVRN